jgi:uncharacterized protein
MRLLIPGLILALSALAASCGEQETLPTRQTDIPLRTDGRLDFVAPDGAVLTSIQVEIADGDSARVRGLMQRRSLGMNEGMLFVFDEPDTLSFWMENTYIPLEMMFVAPDSHIVNIERARPLSRDQVTSLAPARFVVEVRAGFSERFGVGGGTRVRWQRDG